MAVKLVLPNGKAVKLGEPHYKNRAGYDLLHLIIGSEGTLGIVTEAYLNIIPMPSTPIKRVLASFPNSRSVANAIKSLREARLLTSLLEFMDRDTIAAVNRDLENRIEESEAL